MEGSCLLGLSQFPMTGVIILTEYRCFNIHLTVLCTGGLSIKLKQLVFSVFALLVQNVYYLSILTSFFNTVSR